MASDVYFTNAMANPYDVVFRERAVAAYEAGAGTSLEVAALFGLGPSDARTVGSPSGALRGSVAPRPKGGGWRCPIDLGVLRQVVAAPPDATSAELCATYNRRVARLQRTTPPSFRRAMHREGYVLKKPGRGRVRSTARTSG